MLPFGRLWYDAPDNASGYAMHSSRSHHAVIRVYDAADNVIETHEHGGDFKESGVLLAGDKKAATRRSVTGLGMLLLGSGCAEAISEAHRNLSASTKILSRPIAQGHSVNPTATATRRKPLLFAQKRVAKNNRAT